MKEKTILLVDDELTILKSLGRDLRSEGYGVITADSGIKALEIMGKAHPDLLITDLMMEGLDGFQVLKYSKKKDPGRPVIILTGFGDMGSAIDALRLGADDYLLKPCDLEELIFRIDRGLEKQTLLERLQTQQQKLLREIEARKQAEESLRESSEKIKLFAYSVAHDLKNPSIAICGLTRRLQKIHPRGGDEKSRELCDQIVRSSEQIAELVETINSYIATKERPLNFEVVDSGEIVRVIGEEFAHRLKNRHIRWLEPEGVPAIRADRMSMIRVLRNLVDNALKYGGQGLSEIEVGYRSADDFHIFSVRDDGVGLKEKADDGIFTHFSRRETGRNIEGTGLGLSIVKEIAELHQGTAWMEPAAEKGIAFCFSLSKKL